MKQVRGARTQQRDYDMRQSIRAFGDHAIRKHREEYEQRRVRQAAYDIATADPTQIISVRRCNCRWCWGLNHEYQRTDWELERDLNRFIAANRQGITFNEMGGGGFVKSRDPNPECPICLGDGEEVVRITDFRKLSARQKNLISGIKVGKGGVVTEIKFHDKVQAINIFAKIAGMITEKKVLRVLEASEADLDAYFAQNGITLDHDDPELAPFIEKLRQTGDEK
jgi:phage terminase small subunit